MFMKEEVGRRIYNWIKNEREGPIKFDMFITSKCNLNCRFCGYPLKNKSEYDKELKKEKILKIVKEAANLNAKIFGILGGEPFCRKDITLEVMEFAKKSGVSGSLVTNGTLLNEADIKRIVEMQWDLVRFSIDGANARTHDYLRNSKDCFIKVINTIRKFQSIKKELKTNYPTLEINTVLCSKNIRQLPKIINLANKLGVKRIYLLPIIDLTKEAKRLRIAKVKNSKILKVTKEARYLADKYEIDINLSEIERDDILKKSNEMDTVKLKSENSKNYTPCFLPWYSLCVDALGKVTPCAVLSEEEDAFCGDVNKETLKEIWFGEKFRNFRKNMANQKMARACSKCCMPLHDENNEIKKEIKQENLSKISF